MRNTIENESIKVPKSEGDDRYENLPLALKVFFIASVTAAMCIGVYVTFSFVVGGYTFSEIGYFYLLFALCLPGIFLIRPARKKDKGVQWYDLVLTAVSFGIPVYFFYNAWEIDFLGWLPPSLFNFALALIYCLLILEGSRRTVGIVFPAICVIIGVYPLFAGDIPGMLTGVSHPLINVIGSYVYGWEGLLGLPGKVIGNVLLGFLIFAGMLIASGAGKAFLDLAYALVGGYRGGPAKVAVLASGLFGSLSGSVISNVVATGSVTIPAMKRLGYPPHYAAAIEACASTGGCLMPPVMGAVAFIMCVLLGISYATVVMAAAIPAVLYYFGLLMGVDAYAAKVRLAGLPREELPNIWSVLRKSWLFLTVIVFLIWGLMYMRWEMMTPYYGAGLLILLSFTSRETMMTPRKLLKSLIEIAKLVTMVVASVLPIAIILTALSITGVSISLVSSVIYLGGESVFLVLLIGVMACYLMGMVGLINTAYIVLAISLAPAVIEIAGLNELAVHLFIIYYAMLTAITAPVAIAAFVAAGIAKAPAMKTSFTAMRLGFSIYFIPIFFVFNPALILEGPILETLYLFALCLVGIVFIVSGFEGYLLKVGKLEGWSRPPLIVAGILISFPQWITTYIGAALALLIIAIILIKRKIIAIQSTTGR